MISSWNALTGARYAKRARRDAERILVTQWGGEGDLQRVYTFDHARHIRRDPIRRT
jgi:hypothetical protein